MSSKIVREWSLFIGGAVVVAFSILVILLPSNIVRDSVQNIPIYPVQSAILPEREVSALPVRLKIPAIEVDAVVEYVGLAPDGSMGVPKGPNDVAWFDLGPRPGENGSAVLAGHFGWKNNIPAVFDNLYSLHKGNTLTIEDDKGVIATFVVRELRSFGENDDATVVFSSNDGKAHLNLITCEGVWNKVSKSYSGRLVVFADKE